jgi:hypothetical protein
MICLIQDPCLENWELLKLRTGKFGPTYPININVDWAGEHGKGTWDWRAMDIL